ncbi:MAG: hypothetical protein HXY41_07660 [Chloroflexi bacterium]|nr:hypothetical protein [Chloroflexota bacterium]
MTLNGMRTYVGFGLGAIQSGLFLYEAFQSGAFGRLVTAEVVPEVVAAVRQAGGRFTVNIAHADRVEHAQIGPVQIEDPAQEADRERLIEALAQADEIGTAVPSVAFYDSPGPGSLHRILAAGLRRKAAVGGPRAVIYAAENHNHAAEILEAAVMAEIPEAEREAVGNRVRFLNTVIGKMSGVVTEADEIQAAGLMPVTPESPRAFLVEAFNRILISRIHFEPPFTRGIAVFEEKDDLLPFEEAKLYGHNATHALAAYLAMACGAARIADLPGVNGVMPYVRAAFLEESGAALIRKHAGVDALFTPEGYQAYADDLLERMINPFLRDTAERVGRDVARKLGWDDRLIGTMRVALRQGVIPRRYALGAAAALAALHPNAADVPAGTLLDPLWSAAQPEPAERQVVLELIESGRARLRQWAASGFLPVAIG